MSRTLLIHLIVSILSILVFDVSRIVFCQEYGTTLTLKQGLVIGRILKTSNGRDFYAFRGIPYATPPIGLLRFKEPLMYPGWAGTLDARDYCESSRKSPASSSSGPLTKSSSSISSITNPHTVIVTPVAKSGSSTVRALIPAKSTLMKKTTRDGLKVTNKKSSITPPPSTHSMEILVKHPKAPGNKSEFLKALRNEKKEHDENEREYAVKNNSCNKDNASLRNPSDELHVNGIDISKLSLDDEKEKSFLSSSLEAEERLLREMGWKEEVSDDENYAPLTEDELREFRDRSEKILKKNGVRRTLLANLSPLRLAPFPTVPPPTENSSSSSESDSDDS